MPKSTTLLIKQLKLDLKNFRTVPQKSESAAVHSLVSLSPDWFWALAESLFTDGYLPTENIVVIRTQTKRFIVKEGNRRIAAIKIGLGLIPRKDIPIPSHIVDLIDGLNKQWKTMNAEVPCAVYEESESVLVDRIVALTHGKSQKAGRADWNAVARARHNREKSGSSEAGLDLLEKYLAIGQNVTDSQKERWAGDYPLSVLDDAMKRTAARFGASSARDLADKYPSGVQFRDALERILVGIGLGTISFQTIRHPAFESSHDLPPLPVQGGSKPIASGPIQGGQMSKPVPAGSTSRPPNKPYAVATNDPKTVKRILRQFRPSGQNREKVVTLLVEARKLKLADHPLAFCFLLRSMFEVSAKAYCMDHKARGGPDFKKKTGEDRRLVDVLKDIVQHLTQSNQNKAMVKALHGASVELGKSAGFLSVTSMNQLVHNPSFSISQNDIAGLFSNIFPLLEAMN